VARHTPGAVNDEVVLDLGGGQTITATITAAAARPWAFGPATRPGAD